MTDHILVTILASPVTYELSGLTYFFVSLYLAKLKESPVTSESTFMYSVLCKKHLNPDFTSPMIRWCSYVIRL